MARMNVNPTRMELSKLRGKLISARRGHKLLKDKRDELMRRFMDMVRENQKLRREVEEAIRKANAHIAVAGSVMQRQQLETALMLPKQEVELNISEQNVMSVRIPVFEATFRSSDTNDIYSYGTAFTSSDLDDAVKALSEVFPKMIRLAEVEKSCQLMADEIEKTRRRVNALEHIMIPDYEDTIKFITMKLSENERSTATSLLKVKDMVLKRSHDYH
ncbi:MAG: V-type ATP synthase subunit D [Ruminococcus sp.]|nr:V-type ATP synthase subunit D [Oscillospiraceae bacterium]